MSLYDFLIARFHYLNISVKVEDNNSLTIGDMNFPESLLLSWYKINNDFNTVFRFMQLEL